VHLATIHDAPPVWADPRVRSNDYSYIPDGLPLHGRRL
jgi:hypothetical protein